MTDPKPERSLQPWIADDGLMTLGPNQFKPSYKGLPGTTVNNENGILYLVQLMYLTNRDYNFLVTQELLRHPSVPGYFFRNPGGWNRCNSHDNYEAHAAGCIFINETWTFEQVLGNWPVLNDLKPVGPWFLRIKFRRGEPSGIHQPHSWFLYTLAANRRPSWFRTLWYCGNLLWIAFAKFGFAIAERNLAWLRIQAVEKRKHLLSSGQLFLVERVHIFVDNFMRERRGGWKQYFIMYFRPGHPNRDYGSVII